MFSFVFYYFLIYIMIINVPGFGATRQALVYAIVDSYIYANWVFPVAAAILLPNWLLFWVVLHSSPSQEKANKSTG